MSTQRTARTIWGLLRATYAAYRADGVARLAAALAFYAVLALPPTLVLIGTGVRLFLDSATLHEVLTDATGRLPHG